MNVSQVQKTTLSRPLIAVALLLAGCQSTVQLAGPGSAAANAAGATITVDVNGGFHTQAAGSDVFNFEVSLYDYDPGSQALGQMRNRHTTASGTTGALPPLQTHFTNVPPGTYKAVVEAFASDASGLYSVVKGGFVPSSDYVTVADGVAPVFSDGSAPLNVSMPLLNAGRMAPDDAGDPIRHHAYSVTKGAVTSQFVWIPSFGAYQLMNPANCGTNTHATIADNTRPAGFWVRSKPFAGQRDVDWRWVQFGGFYAGKYEASRADADNTTQGTSTTLSVRYNVAPWVYIDWDSAARACRAYDSHCAMMGGEEWTALAVWAMTHGKTVYGNNNGLADIDNAGVTFTADPTASPGSTALTGTGGVSTTHTGDGGGVYDLNGNLWEWSADVASDDADYTKWMIDGIRTGKTRPQTTDAVASLDFFFRRLGLPGSLSSTPPAEFGHDTYIYTGSPSLHNAARGGAYLTGVGAGLWSLDLTQTQGASQASIGFRPVLRY